MTASAFDENAADIFVSLGEGGGEPKGDYVSHDDHFGH